MTLTAAPGDTTSFADRINALQGAHSWMDAPVLATVAQQTASPEQAVQVGDTLRSSLQGNMDSVASMWDDPALYTHDSAAVELRQFLSNSMNAPPIAQPDLSSTQTELQKLGFGKTLVADGVWGSEWQSAFSQAFTAHTNNAYAGNRPGAVNAHEAAHGFLSSIMPMGLVHNLMGYVKALPRDVANLASDVVGGAAEIGAIVPGEIMHPGTAGIQQAQRFGARVGTDVNTGLGGTQETPEQFYNKETGGARVINDLGTILALAPTPVKGGNLLGRGAVTAAQGARGAARVGLVRGLTDVGTQEARDAALRSPQLIARTLGTSGLARRTAIGAGTGAALGAGTAAVQGGNIAQGAEYGAITGAAGLALLGSPVTQRVLGTDRFAVNFPGQAQMGPWIGKIAQAGADSRVLDPILTRLGYNPAEMEGGLYYKARTLLAQPYRVPLVRGVGNAYATAIPYSLGIGLQSSAAGHFDPSNPLTSAIRTDHTLDPLDQRLQALTSGVTGGRVSLGLNDLALFLHGDLPTGLRVQGRSSADVTKAAQAVNDHMNDVLGTVGASGAIHRVLQDTLGKDWTPQKMIDTTFGGDVSAYNEFWGMKLQAMAAYRAADTALTEQLRNGWVPNATERRDFLEAETNRVLSSANNPDAADELTPHLHALVTSNSPTISGEIQNRLRRDITTGTQKPETALRHGAADYIKAVRVARGIITSPDAMNHVITPDSWVKYRDAQSLASSPLGRPGESEELGQVPASTWLTGNGNSHIPGSTGMARLDAVDKATWHAFIHDQVAPALAQATTPDDINGVMKLALDAINLNFGYDTNALSVFTPDNLLARMDDLTQRLGSKVHLSSDAPAQLRDMVSRLHDLGYQLWHGTDIGHHLRLPDPGLDLTAPVTRARRLIGHLGLNPEHFRSRDVSAYRRDAARKNIQNLFDTGTVRPLPYDTADSIINRVMDAAQNPDLGALGESLYGLGTRFRKTLVAAHAQATGTSEKEAVDALHSEITRIHSPADVPRALFDSALGDGAEVPAAQGYAGTTTGYAPEDIDALYRAVKTGYATAPGYMIGAQRLDDLMRVGFGLGGHDWGGRLGAIGNSIGQHAFALGDKYGTLRGNLRFQMSPAFSFRRVYKANLKLGLEGITPSTTPVQDLVEADAYEKAHALLARLMPEFKNPDQDEFDRALHSADLFAIYQPKQYMARAAWEAKNQGMADDDIRSMLTRAFEYGNGRFGEGRTALERSTNTIFFPFSFEKTVLRNIGQYLLDRPAQLYMLNAGLAAYEQFSSAHPNDPMSAPWLQAHVPLLNEILRLNPFAHGLSPGEFGGINAPLLNLFLPQSWDAAHKGNLGLLARLVPATADVSRVWKETSQQSQIGWNAIWNTVDQVDRTAAQNGYTPRPVITDSAQKSAAFTERAALIKQIQPLLDANRHLPAASQLRFPNLPGVDKALRGATVSKQTIDFLLHEKYPAYDPMGAAKYADDLKAKSTEFLDSIKDDPNRYLAYSTFAALVDRFRAHVTAGNYRDNPGQAEQLTRALRQFAFTAALQGNNGGQDKDFIAWYKSTIEHTLGPLTGAP